MRSKKFYLVWSCYFFLVVGISNLYSQPNLEWTKTYGGTGKENAYSVQQTMDGGFIIVCETNTNSQNGNSHLFLIKTDQQGDTIWTKIYGGSSGEIANDVKQTKDGGYIAAGTTYSFGAGKSDAWLLKTDGKGDTLWSKTFGGVDLDEAFSVLETSDGFVFCGLTQSFSDVGDIWPGEVWLVKTNLSGDRVWTKTFGGSHFDIGVSVQQTEDSGYILAGWERSSTPTHRYRAWLIKTDANGDSLWSKKYDSNQTANGFESVQLTEDGGFIICGWSMENTSTFKHDAWLVKTDSLGNTIWTKHYGGSDNDQVLEVQQTADKGYIFAGATDSYGAGGSDVWIIKTDVSGDTIWTKTYGGSKDDRANSIIQTIDGYFVVCGYTASFGSGEEDIWLIKINDVTVGINTEEDITSPNNFLLHQNYPNPFNPTTTIGFQLPQKEFVSLKLYDVLGNEVATLLYKEVESGNHKIMFDASSIGRELASGMYFYRIKAGKFTDTKRLTLMK